MFDLFRGKKAAFYVAIVIVAVAAYGNTLLCGFVYDDIEQILRNPWILELSNLPYFFFHDVWSFADLGASNYYRPVMYVVFTVEHAVFGLKPWGYHLVNVVLHALNSVMVYVLGRELFFRHVRGVEVLRADVFAFAGALLFALHTVNSESVAWISAVPELTYTFFVLLSFYFYVTDEGRHSRRLLYSVIAFFAASFCKETAFALPLLIVLYDFSLYGRSFLTRERFSAYLFYFIAGCLYLSFRFGAIEGFAPDVRFADLTAAQSFINIFPLFLKYLFKLVLPVNLSAYHDFSPIKEINAAAAVGIIIAAAYVATLWRSLRRAPVIFFFLLWVIVPLLPVFYIKGLGYNAFTERYLYLPSVGFSLLVSCVALKAHEAGYFGKRSIAVLTFIFAVFATTLFAATIIRNTAWRDNYSLWSDALGKAVNKCVPYNSYGLVYLGDGRINEAKKVFEEAISMAPDCSQVHTNLGYILMQEKKLDEAALLYQKAIELEPGRSLNYFNLGLVRRSQGRLNDAVALYVKSLRINADKFERRRELHWTVAQLKYERRKKH